MTAGRYTPRKSNRTDSTAFSFSPMIFGYFIPALGSAPAAVMTPHTRAPPALAARQKASGQAISILRTSSSGIFALPLPTPNAASATSTPWACGATSSSSRSMLTTTSKTLGSAKASVLRRVTTTTFLHSGLLIRSCTMRPPTFPVAPSTIAEYCAFVIEAAVLDGGDRMRDGEIERDKKVNVTPDSDVAIRQCARQHRRQQGNEEHGQLVQQAHSGAQRFHRRQF